jgi:hypothetical protein
MGKIAVRLTTQSVFKSRLYVSSHNVHNRLSGDMGPRAGDGAREEERHAPN